MSNTLRVLMNKKGIKLERAKTTAPTGAKAKKPKAAKTPKAAKAPKAATKKTTK
jgi:hypothetical protein